MVEQSHQDASPNEAELEPLEEPRYGTLAWLAQQPTVELAGLTLPAVHRVPADATISPELDGHCRVVRADGERCSAPATRRYGLCLPHVGGGGFRDPVAMSRRGNATRARLRAQRSLLGIGSRRAGDPRQRARIEASARSAELAEALLAPLNDAELGSLSRQRAAVTILDATFPIQTASVELELPLDQAGVAELGWEQMQQLAATILSTQQVPELEQGQ